MAKPSFGGAFFWKLLWLSCFLSLFVDYNIGRSCGAAVVANDDDDVRARTVRLARPPRRRLTAGGETEEEVVDESDPEYYDLLRYAPLRHNEKNGTLEEAVVVPAQPQDGLSVQDVQTGTSIEDGSAIYRVEILDGEQNSTTSYRLADIKTFLPFTLEGSELQQDAVNDAFTVLLALYHFNNAAKDELPGILPPDDVERCRDLKLTTELFDSEFSPIETTRTFTSVLQRTASLQRPPPAGVVGAFRSAVTMPLAILTGVNNIPQVSHAATAGTF